MKRWIKPASGALLAGATLLVASVAWTAKPIDYVRGPFPFGPFPFFDCTQFDGMDYWVWVRGESMDVGKIFTDDAGNWIKTVSTEFTSDAMVWAPADPGCNSAPFAGCVDPFTPMAGTNAFTIDDTSGRTEHQNSIYRDWVWIDEGGGFWYPTWGQKSGTSLHIVLPGYGAIFTTAGHLVHQFNFQTFEWDVVSATPNWENHKSKDVYALCSYIGNR